MCRAKEQGDRFTEGKNGSTEAVKLPSALSSDVRSDHANCAVRARTAVCDRTPSLIGENGAKVARKCATMNEKVFN